jgi:hypothetical protein
MPLWFDQSLNHSHDSAFAKAASSKKGILCGLDSCVLVEHDMPESDSQDERKMPQQHVRDVGDDEKPGFSYFGATRHGTIRAAQQLLFLRHAGARHR